MITILMYFGDFYSWFWVSALSLFLLIPATILLKKGYRSHVPGCIAAGWVFFSVALTPPTIALCIAAYRLICNLDDNYYFFAIILPIIILVIFLVFLPVGLVKLVKGCVEKNNKAIASGAVLLSLMAVFAVSAYFLVGHFSSATPLVSRYGISLW